MQSLTQMRHIFEVERRRPGIQVYHVGCLGFKFRANLSPWTAAWVQGRGPGAPGHMHPDGHSLPLPPVLEVWTPQREHRLPWTPPLRLQHMRRHMLQHFCMSGNIPQDCEFISRIAIKLGKWTMERAPEVLRCRCTEEDSSGISSLRLMLSCCGLDQTQGGDSALLA